ncbi:hypothetical protein ACS0TY_033435 [Phlomoides rotata]
MDSLTELSYELLLTELELQEEELDSELIPGYRVCAICDDGGILILCEGKCMRAFHANLEHGEHSLCESLCITNTELLALGDTAFYCANCTYEKHQCFVCGELGSSNESSPEVFCCSNEACCYFYHPHCVGELLYPGNSAAAEELEQRIAAGEQFVCPAHRCHVCGEVEVTLIAELQFAVCRRCPRAYHRRCLPREITREEDVDIVRGIVQRAWEETMR